MIEIKNVSKSFGEIQAVSQVSLTLKEQNVFGMLGTNGAGKSTLLRMMAGVMRPDEGEILIDGENVWDNPEAKRKIFYISDDQFFSQIPRRKRWRMCTACTIRTLTGDGS